MTETEFNGLMEQLFRSAGGKEITLHTTEEGIARMLIAGGMLPEEARLQARRLCESAEDDELTPES